MKVLIIGDPKRSERYMPNLPITREVERVFVPLKANIEEILKVGADAEVIIADAIAKVPADLIEKMPKLKMIHSEGVAYNGIDIAKATQRQIYVCNNKGMNASAVAEQAILLMLGLLRDVISGHASELEGEQIRVKERKMVEGITDLADCKVGLIGFGDIAKATAERLHAFGSQVYYYNRSRKSAEEEEKYHVQYLSLEELASRCDIISIHVAVTPQTIGMIDKAFLSKMKPTAYFINTSRGELVNNVDMKEALEQGIIAGAGFDTIAPEPTTKDNPLLNLASDCQARVVYSPHIGGITTGSFQRGYRMMWENVSRIAAGERPNHIVNNV
ncbi:MAG: 2-hydroxyacid dehydrogenase [Lachnospiraceae bacterium]